MMICMVVVDDVEAVLHLHVDEIKGKVFEIYVIQEEEETYQIDMILVVVVVEMDG